MARASGSPVLVSPQGPCSKLERIRLGAGTHNEAWLQALIFDHPQLLPIAQIEPGFGSPLSVAREVACGHGYIDNLFLTPSGEIILVETKLWRNLEARREVVAQALDYVSALMRLRYDAFEAAVLAAQGASSPASLYAVVADHPEALDEPQFIDAVSRNLARGRMLVLALGDGIREEAEALAELLQSHAGAHFTFALVELASWRDAATGNIVLLPGTLAQTVMIERGVLRFEGTQPTIEAVPRSAEAKPKSLTEEMFFEQIARRDPLLPGAIRSFLAMVAPLGVYPEFLASLNLKFDLEDAARPANFGYIRKDGRFCSSPLSWTLPGDIATRYNQRLAALIDGQVSSQDSIYVSTNGSSEPFISALLPAGASEWADAIRQVIREAREVQGEGAL